MLMWNGRANKLLVLSMLAALLGTGLWSTSRIGYTPVEPPHATRTKGTDLPISDTNGMVEKTASPATNPSGDRGGVTPINKAALASIADECNSHQRDVKTNCFIVADSYFVAFSSNGTTPADREEKLLVPLSSNPGAELYVQWYRHRGTNDGLVAMSIDDPVSGGGGGGNGVDDAERLIESEYRRPLPRHATSDSSSEEDAPVVAESSISEHVSRLDPIQRHLFDILFNHSLNRRFEFQRLRHLTNGKKGRKMLKKSPLPCALHPSMGLPLQHPFVTFHRNHLKALTIEWAEDPMTTQTAAKPANNVHGLHGNDLQYYTVLSGRSHHKVLQTLFPTTAQGPPLKVILISGLGYFQAHVSGGYFTNMWHTVGDYYNLMFHTLSRLWIANKGPSTSKEQSDGLPELTWITRTPNSIQGKGCKSSSDCRSYSLFDPFRKAFRDRILFIDDEARVGDDADKYCDGKNADSKEAISDNQLRRARAVLHFPFILLGLKNKCCPIPMEGVGHPECHRTFRAMRDFTLAQYGLDPQKRVCTHLGTGGPIQIAGDLASGKVEPLSGAAPNCVSPFIHIMSRQKDKFRHFTPFDEMVAEIKKVAVTYPSSHTDDSAAISSRFALGNSSAPIRAEVVVLHGGMSFEEQLYIIFNTTVLVAGRGGGTAFSLFLPFGATYLSISGHDRWNPWRDLQPDWYHLVHHTAAFVHHDDPKRPPQMFGGTVDGNRAAYKVDPQAVGRSVSQALMLIDGGLPSRHP